MIKQIVDFSRDDEGKAAIIEVFVLADNPEQHVALIKELIEDGAIIQSADRDTIRAVYRKTNQDKLLELLEDGWAFTQDDAPGELKCQDQACRDCIEPCDSKEAEERNKFEEFTNEVNRKIAEIEAEPDRLTPMVDRLIAESEREAGPERAGLLEAVEMLNTMLKEHNDEELSVLRFEATGGNYGQDRRAIIEFADKLEERLNQYFAGKEAV